MHLLQLLLVDAAGQVAAEGSLDLDDGLLLTVEVPWLQDPRNCIASARRAPPRSGAVAAVG